MEADALARGVRGCDAAFRAAAQYRIGIRPSEAAAMREINLGGTQRVLDAAAAACLARIVYVSKARRELGYAPRELAMGLRETAANAR